MTIAKPVKRGPKPRKPLPRVWRKGCLPDGLARHKALMGEADALWDKAVERRAGQWGPICEWCHMRPWSQRHHLVTRAHHATRWLVENSARLCACCHMAVTRDSEDNRDLALSLIGASEWERLNMLKRATKTDVALHIVALRVKLANREGR